jgi:hypothetical protein
VSEIEKPDDIVGHKTMVDGTHVPLRRDEADALWASIESAKAARIALMPDWAAALQMMSDALSRLNDEGWARGAYCPKDGSPFAIIEFGSTGIFEAFYSGTWPDGHVIACDFVSHPDGMLWKAIDKLSPAERAKLDECMALDKQMHEREVRAFAAMDGPR